MICRHRNICLSLILIFISISTSAQKNHWVFFTDKHGVSFEPYSYFDEKAIDRRIREGISLYDTSDFPLSDVYKDSLHRLGFTILAESRWLNAVKVSAGKRKSKSIESLDFVRKVSPSNKHFKEYHDLKPDSVESVQLLAKLQLEQLEANEFISRGIDGSGVRIAVFDGGFPGVDKSSYFSHLVNGNKIIATRDFIKPGNTVYSSVPHGTQVLSCISGMDDSLQLGLATGAEFLLARTEILRERFVEEEYWLLAAEWADKMGADIISTSLGYTHPRYTKKEMDGETSLVAKAAKIASGKGIVVVASIGNDGAKRWRVLCTPADVSEVVSVGGVDPKRGTHLSFSSYGPNSKFDIKPNVSAAGIAAVVSKQGLIAMGGTSYATPLVTGFLACMWQLKPELKAEELRLLLHEASSLFPYYDYIHGYGIPKAGYFFNEQNDGENYIIVKTHSQKIFLEADFYNLDSESELIFYSINLSEKVLMSFGFDVLTKENPYVEISVEKYPKAQLIRFHFAGSTNSYYVNEKFVH